MAHKNELPIADTIPKVFDSLTDLFGIPLDAPAAPARKRRRSQHFYYAPPIPTTNARDKMAYKRDGEQPVSEAAHKEEFVCCSRGSRGEMLESY